MQNKLLLKYVKPYLFSLFFTAAMSSLFWITMTYGSLNAVPIAAGLCALMYTGLALAALVNLFRGNKLFEGSSADVLSVNTQKRIRVAGIAVALPALVYCGIFAYLVKSYDFTESANLRVSEFEKVETAVFGSSKIWSFILPVGAAQTLEPTTVEPTAAEPDFGPYMAEMQVRIKKAWTPGKFDRSKRTAVFFVVDKVGSVSDLRIENSSGSKTMDQAALDAVRRAAPFKTLPSGSPSRVDILFTFDYNVFSPVAAGTPDTFSSSTDTASTGDTFSSSN